MIIFKFILLLVSVLPTLSVGVKVDMQGSIRLGKDVLESLSHIIVNKKERSGRRSLGNEDEATVDTISLIVNAAFLCRDLNFCHGDVGILVNNYIIMLTRAVESVFEGLISDDIKKQNENTIKVVIFEEELKQLILDIKKLLINTNEKISDGNEGYTWVDLLKTINSKFQERAVRFASQRLEGNAQEINEVKKKLTQKLVTATTYTEQKFENKLCTDYDVCSKSFECTKSLNILLKKLKIVSDERVKEFLKHFYEALPTTVFYSKLSEATGREFQSILFDMAYSDNILTKNVLSIVQRSVEDRLNLVTSKVKKRDSATARDVKLMHIMLSDLDHIYSKQNEEPFQDFFVDFFEWTKEGGPFGSSLRRLIKDLQNVVSSESEELVLKLVNEMRVFMEITVDPDL